MQARQNAFQTATTELASVNERMEASRRQMLHWMAQANKVRNQISQGEASLEGYQREAERLSTERAGVHSELEKLGVERGQVSLNFASASTALQDTEAELQRLRANWKRSARRKPLPAARPINCARSRRRCRDVETRWNR